jgi:hypothetical protein
MAINKKAAARVAAVLILEQGNVAMARSFVNRLLKAADSKNKSFNKSFRRVMKALAMKAIKTTTIRHAA